MISSDHVHTSDEQPVQAVTTPTRSDLTAMYAEILARSCTCLRRSCTLRTSHGLDCCLHKDPVNPEAACPRLTSQPRSRAPRTGDIHAYYPWKTDPVTGKRIMADNNRGRILISVMCERCQLDTRLKLGRVNTVFLSEKRGKEGVIRGKLFADIATALQYARVIFVRAWGINTDAHVHYLRNSYVTASKLFVDASTDPEEKEKAGGVPDPVSKPTPKSPL